MRNFLITFSLFFWAVLPAHGQDETGPDMEIPTLIMEPDDLEEVATQDKVPVSLTSQTGAKKPGEVLSCSDNQMKLYKRMFSEYQRKAARHFEQQRKMLKIYHDKLVKKEGKYKVKAFAANYNNSAESSKRTRIKPKTAKANAKFENYVLKIASDPTFIKPVFTSMQEYDKNEFQNEKDRKKKQNRKVTSKPCNSTYDPKSDDNLTKTEVKTYKITQYKEGNTTHFLDKPKKVADLSDPARFHIGCLQTTNYYEALNRQDTTRESLTFTIDTKNNQGSNRVTARACNTSTDKAREYSSSALPENFSFCTELDVSTGKILTQNTPAFGKFAKTDDTQRFITPEHLYVPIKPENTDRDRVFNAVMKSYKDGAAEIGDFYTQNYESEKVARIKEFKKELEKEDKNSKRYAFLSEEILKDTRRLEGYRKYKGYKEKKILQGLTSLAKKECRRLAKADPKNDSGVDQKAVSREVAKDPSKTPSVRTSK